MTADFQSLRRQAHAWALKLKTGRPTVADVAAFEAWRAQSPAHARAWSLAAHDWQAIGEGVQLLAAGEAGAAQAAAPGRPAPARGAGADAAGRGAWPRPGRRLFLGAAVPAAGALAVLAVVRPPLGLWPSWRELAADYRTATGEQRIVRLGGGLDLSLNTQTSVAVSEANGQARIALIAGEAAISARHAQCEVLAQSGRLSLQDAEAEVRHLAGGRVRVVCRAGAARLSHPVRTMSLAAGEQVVYDSDRVGAAARPDPAQSAWRQGMVVFEDMPLDEVVAEINRYRPGRVVLVDRAMAGRRFSARFRIGALDEAIELLRVAHDVPVRRVGELVLLG